MSLKIEGLPKGTTPQGQVAHGRRGLLIAANTHHAGVAGPPEEFQPGGEEKMSDQTLSKAFRGVINLRGNGTKGGGGGLGAGNHRTGFL